MQIDWINFTPWWSLAGGALIGAAAALLINLNGRIMGASNILGGLLGSSSDKIWRVCFLAGLIFPAIVVNAIGGAKPSFLIGTGGLIAAGLLVGFGTRLGSGCTSGHGVCGMSRLSPRSIVATVAFMVTGFLTVYAVRHLLAGGAQ